MFSRHRGHTFVAPPTDNEVTIYISENTFDFNLLARIGAAFTQITTVTIRIDTGVIVQALSPGTPALDTANVMFAGSVLRIINNGYIIGAGGAGGGGSACFEETAGADTNEFHGAQDGRDGGNALRGPGAGITCQVTNGAGRIWSGGGGGGGGGSSATNGGGAGGGGGGGAGGGASSDAGAVGTIVAGQGAGGSTGVDGVGGAGGAGTSSGSASGQAGGAGGDYGEAGTDGTAAVGGVLNVPRGLGGTAGLAVDQNGGTVTFLNGGGAPNVLGAIA